MAALVEPLPASEYGVMPTSFSKSQKVKRTTLETETTQASSSGPSKPVRRPILMRDKFDGVDSDDESDSDGGQGEMDGDEDERPVVVDDVDVDMEEEEEEFLKFSREALGISDDLWGQIIRERQEKGGKLHSPLTNHLLSTLAHFLPQRSSHRHRLPVSPSSSPKKICPRLQARRRHRHPKYLPRI